MLQRREKMSRPNPIASLVGDQAAETGQGYASSEETTKGFAAVEASARPFCG